MILQIMSLIIFAYIFFMISIPLIFKRIKPNFLYDFKIKKRLGNEEIWYKTNKILGINLYISAIIMIFGAMILYYLLYKINRIFFQFIFFIVFFIPIFLSIIIFYFFLYKLKSSSSNKE